MSLHAQVSSNPEAYTGMEIRSLDFDRLSSVRRLTQTVIPVGAGFPLGRFTLDLGASWVHTRLVRADGSAHPVDAFTDSQIRGSYVFGQDAVVATVLMNLPTGLERASARDYTVIGAVSPSLLGFPVAAYASGFSVTTGLAASVPSGDWSLGLAGSVRVSSSFTPYADALGAITYKPGLEGRVRGAVDGLVGSSHLTAGFTYSTFGDDRFGTTLATRGEYRPGPRWLAEAILVSPVGANTLTVTAWNFRRTAGDTTGGSARNRENLAAGEVSLLVPLSRSVALEPGLSGRASKPESGRGRMIGGGAGVRFQPVEAVSLSFSARYDRGWLEDNASNRTDIHGGYFSGLIRVSF
ncbi:MAG TPA: hypothetical protein VFU23_02875 [Gemmatimonadales bacterium]|nr:hypothetical protein [Gemmatimonadales bacterium]